MEIIIRDNNIGHGFIINKVSVHNNLTFCELGNNSAIYPALLRLVKAGIIYSFEPKKDAINVAFYTKYVEKIF